MGNVKTFSIAVEGRFFTAEEIDRQVGRNVREMRRLQQMTQKDLADKIGVEFQQLQKYETGLNRFSASRLWMTGEALGAPVQDFFIGLCKKDKQAPLITPAEASMLADFRKLPPQTQEAIRGVISVSKPYLNVTGPVF